MTACEVIATLTQQGIYAMADGGEIVLRGKKKLLTPELRDTICRHKPELLTLLRERDDPEGHGCFYWIRGTYYGPKIGTYPIGRCGVCHWCAPLTAGGSCVLCEQSDRNGVIDRFCGDECDGPIVGRIDPGGLFCCAKCRERIRSILQIAQTSRTQSGAGVEA